jgi:hypothetical protein
MKIIDGIDPQRISRNPDKTILLVSGQGLVEQGYAIKKVELRLFVEKTDADLGPFSLITALVETDKGQIEMIYDEGYRGNDALDKTANFLINNLGLSGLILRSIIALESKT